MDDAEEEEAQEEDEAEEANEDNEAEEGGDEDGITKTPGGDLGAATPAEIPATTATSTEPLPTPPTIEITSHSPIPPSQPTVASMAEHAETPSSAIPANAIELVNTAPGSTEMGTGDLGAQAGIEIHKPDLASPKERAAELVSPAEHEKMDVDMVDNAETGLDNNAIDGVKSDEGLVMGEMEPPKGLEALDVVGGDHEPPEVEAEGESI